MGLKMNKHFGRMAGSLRLIAFNVHAGTIPFDLPSTRYGDLFADRFERQPLALLSRI